jgi:hypothetical protein
MSGDQRASATHETPERGIVRPVTKPGTYRLPLDAHEIIAAEVKAAAAKGDTRSQAEVITYALRHTYRPDGP